MGFSRQEYWSGRLIVNASTGAHLSLVSGNVNRLVVKSNLESIYLLHHPYGKIIRQRTLWCKEMDIHKEIEEIKKKHYANGKALWKLMGKKS